MSNELEQVGQLDSVLDSISQIDSVLGEVVVISSNFIYSGEITLNDWVEGVDEYTFTILKSNHYLNNPCLIAFDVYNGTNYENAFVSYIVNSNGDMVLKVDEPVVAKFKLEGEQV